MPNKNIPTGQAKLRARSRVSGCFHRGGDATVSISTWKGAFIRFTESPRSWLKPMDSRTSAVMRSSCSAGQRLGHGFAPLQAALVVHHHGCAQALDGAAPGARDFDRFVHLVVGRGFALRLPDSFACCWPAAVGAGLAPLMGAAEGPGGWLATAPETPVAVVLVLPLVSMTCWLRMAVASGVWFGRNCSDVDSVWLKSRVGRHLRPYVVAAHDGLEHLHDAARVLLLKLLHVLQLLGVKRPTLRRVGRIRQQLSGVIQHADRRGRKLRHARDATRCTMPASCVRSSTRPGYKLMSTEAEGFCCSRKKPFWLGKAKCTRALCTDDSAWIERVSSPSSPR